MLPEEIFTPGTFPQHTYVPRDDKKFETLLEESLNTPGMLVSVLGPSKAGKTVLLERVVGATEVRIPGVESADTLWRRVLGILQVPIPHSHSSNTGAEASSKSGFALPGGALSGETAAKVSSGQQHSSSFESAPFEAAVAALLAQKRVLVLDDFHYVDRAQQTLIAKQLKEAISRKAQVVVLAVPHGSDDPIRANPDLRGRVISIDLGLWSPAELQKIGALGFPQLGYTVAPDDLALLASETHGSPSLMQALCLGVCRLVAKETRYVHNGTISLGREGVNAASRLASSIADASTPYNLLSAGPPRHGNKRSDYTFIDGATGDVYVALLRAIREDPPQVTITYEEMRGRLEHVIKGDGPQGQQWAQALGHMAGIVREKLPLDRVLDWDAETKILSIPDPYFLFYLRWKIWPR